MFPSNPYNGQRHTEQNKEFVFNGEGWVPIQKQVFENNGGTPTEGVPYTGAIGNVNLGTHKLLANAINLPEEFTGTTSYGDLYYNSTTHTVEFRGYDGTTKTFSDENFTTALKTKLDSINDHYRGTHLSYAALVAAVPFGNPGDEAIVDAVGIDPKKYIWDATDEIWALGTGTSVTVDQSIIEGSINAVAGGAVFSAIASLLTSIGLKVSTTEKGVANGVATLGADGFIPAGQIKPVGSDVIELLEITALIGEVVDMVEGDKVFDTSDKKIYTYTAEVWDNPTTPEVDKLYLCKADTLTYKWNGTTLVTTTSPLPYASASVTILGTSSSTVVTPLGLFTAFKYWLANTVFSSLNTTAKTIIGAINELTTKELVITKYGINGAVYPAIFPTDKARVIIGYRLATNCTDFSVVIGASTYTKANITNVTVASGAELIVNDLTIVAGQNVANAILILK